MKRWIFFPLLFVSSSLMADVTPPPPPPTNLPLIRAELTNLGTTAVCYGQACADVMDHLFLEWEDDPTMHDGPVEPYELDHDDFCAALNANKPSGCSLSNIPPAPGITLNWQPNGCGPSDPSFLTSVGLFFLANIDPMPFYSGDRDAPVAGTSFLNACNTHDQCWGYAFDKGGCDATFRANMMDECAASSFRTPCEAIADAYYDLVNGTTGGPIYADAVSDRTCANWAFDRSNNGCT